MMDLLKELTEAQSAPGYEHEVREIMRRELEKTTEELVYDRTGSIFGKVSGKDVAPTIMLAGHMDEVAFMVNEVTEKGYLRFTPLGGWWEQVLLSQRVKVIAKDQKFTGVVGSKPPHLLTKEERSKVFPMKEMFIDVGGNSAEQVKEWGIQTGDPIVPVCPYELLPDDDTILAKALDNRVGCYLALEVMKQLNKEKSPNTVYGGATVQEEVGLRGAQTSPYVVEPDVAFALDVGIAQDGPSNDDKNKPKLGAGPLVTFLDATMIPNVKLRNLVTETANEKNIPYQVEVMMGGGTDAGKFHMFKKGVPTIVIGVAARYIHSHVSMVSKKDVENAVKLIVEVIRKIDLDQYKSILDYRS